MFVTNIEFDPQKDIREVDQFGFVDLHDAMLNGTIPSHLEAQEANFNHIEDPRMMRQRPDDVFASLRAEQNYGSFIRHQREQSTAQADKNP